MISSSAAVYVISVAADLAGMHPQTLRQYDRLGLVTPERTAGRGRRYSADDVAKLRLIQSLSQKYAGTSIGTSSDRKFPGRICKKTAFAASFVYTPCLFG